jgi:hypothetical protein
VSAEFLPIYPYQSEINLMSKSVWVKGIILKFA